MKYESTHTDRTDIPAGQRLQSMNNLSAPLIYLRRTPAVHFPVPTVCPSNDAAPQIEHHTAMIAAMQWTSPSPTPPNHHHSSTSDPGAALQPWCEVLKPDRLSFALSICEPKRRDASRLFVSHVWFSGSILCAIGGRRSPAQHVHPKHLVCGSSAMVESNPPPTWMRFCGNEVLSVAYVG